MCDGRRGERAPAGDDSSVSCERTRGRDSLGVRGEAEYLRKELCASAREGWSAFPPASPHSNRSGEVAAKAAALIEETMSSCDAAAFSSLDTPASLSYSP